MCTLAGCGATETSSRAEPSAETQTAPVASASSSDPAKTPSDWPKVSLTKAKDPPRVWLVFNAQKRVFVHDETPANRKPKQLGKPNVEILIGHGIVAGGWIIDPVAIVGAAPITLVSEGKACVDTPKQRWLVGSPGTEIRWMDVAELAGCKKSKAETTAGVFWDELAVEGQHADATFAPLASLDATGEAREREKLGLFLASPENAHRSFGDTAADATFSRFSDDIITVRTGRGATSGAPPEVESLLRVMVRGSVVGTVENESVNAALLLGGRKFLLMEKNRILEVTAAGLLDAGSLLGAKPSG